MKRTRIILITGAASLFAVAAFSSNPLPEDTMYAVRRMLRVAQPPFQDNLTWDYEVIGSNYSPRDHGGHSKYPFSPNHAVQQSGKRKIPLGACITPSVRV